MVKFIVQIAKFHMKVNGNMVYQTEKEQSTNQMEIKYKGIFLKELKLNALIKHF